MNTNSLAKFLQMTGLLLMCAAAVRGLTLRSVFDAWDEESRRYFMCDVDVDLPYTQHQTDAICFSRVSDKFVQGRVLSCFGDKCGGKRSVGGIVLGLLLYVCSRAILRFQNCKGE